MSLAEISVMPFVRCLALSKMSLSLVSALSFPMSFVETNPSKSLHIASLAKKFKNEAVKSLRSRLLIGGIPNSTAYTHSGA